MSRFDRDSLTGKMLRQFLRGLGAGIFIFFVLYFGGRQWLDRYFLTSDHFYNAEEGRVEQLQKYVDKNIISAIDMEALKKWAKENGINNFTVSREDMLLFDVSYAGEQLPPGAKVADYGWHVFYNVNFADGDADVYIYEGYAEKYIRVFLILASLCGFAVCMGIFVSGVKEEAEYIRLLKAEVSTIGKGNLQKNITVKGKDELAELASGLNQMRLKLIEKETIEEKMRSDQEKLVLGMSHDLRTPLTGLLTYIEILNKQKKKGEISQKYIDKIFDKALQIRSLSDQMFEFFLVNSQKETMLESPEEVESALGDYLSELCALLGCSGFQIDVSELEWRQVFVRINTDYMGRIMNNIISNIEKYGDNSCEIQMKINYIPDGVGLSIQNAIALPNQYVQGTGIGVENIRLMMDNMGGTIDVNMSEETYCMLLWFPSYT